MKTLQFEYDPERDVLTVEGVKYAGALFRDLGPFGAVGDCFQIMKREDGTVWLRTIPKPADYTRGWNDAIDAAVPLAETSKGYPTDQSQAIGKLRRG